MVKQHKFHVGDQVLKSWYITGNPGKIIEEVRPGVYRCQFPGCTANFSPSEILPFNPIGEDWSRRRDPVEALHKKIWKHFEKSGEVKSISYQPLGTSGFREAWYADIVIEKHVAGVGWERDHLIYRITWSLTPSSGRRRMYYQEMR